MTVFRHDSRDGWLVAVALGQLAVFIAGTLVVGTIPVAAQLLLGAGCVFLVCTNYQCVAHNFLHNPFFVSDRVNVVFGVLNSACIGVPQTLYRLHHLHHHKHNNDAPDPVTGTTNDLTSTWRYSRRPGHEEGLIAYALLGFWRSDFTHFLGVARRRGLLGRVLLESAALVVVGGTLTWVHPWGVVVFAVPVWLLGQISAQAENWFEHHGATPGDRKRDSVSSYGTFYNWIWFNNGYHQEHHFRPQVHWTEVPKLRDLLPPEDERRVVWGAHWFNLGRVRRELTSPDQEDT